MEKMRRTASAEEHERLCWGAPTAPLGSTENSCKGILQVGGHGGEVKTEERVICSLLRLG